MARYEHLPIYKAAMDMAILIERQVRGFPRYHKYTLGSELRAGAHEIVRLVIQANPQADRLATLARLRDTVEMLKVSLRIGQEVQAFKSFQAFAQAIERTILAVPGSAACSAGCSPGAVFTGTRRADRIFVFQRHRGTDRFINPTTVFMTPTKGNHHV